MLYSIGGNDATVFHRGLNLEWEATILACISHWLAYTFMAMFAQEFGPEDEWPPWGTHSAIQAGGIKRVPFRDIFD